MNRFLKTICIVSLLAGSGITAVRGPNYDDIRALGMGNTTIPVTTDRTAIFHNPAGLCLIKDDLQFSFTPIAFGIDGIFFELIQQMVDNRAKLSDLAKIDQDFLDMINQYDGQWVGLQYFPEFTVASRRMGFGVYTVLPIGVRIESSHLIPKLELRGERDIVFAYSVGFPLRHANNYGGVSVEYLQRTPLDMISTYSQTFLLFDEIGKNPFGIIGDYADVKHGVSFDVGFMHNLHGFRFAWDVKDILGVVGGELVFPPQLDLGVSYFFPQLDDVKAIRNLIVALEVTNIAGVEPTTEKYEHFFKKVHIGGEIDLNYAALRLGISQGYPTIGMGLRFGMFKADYAFFTEEIGYFPGQLPVRKHLAAIGVEFNVARKKGKDIDIEASNLYNKAMNLYSQGKYYEAFFVFGKILYEYPSFFKNDWVQLYLSLCMENMDMRDLSSVNFAGAKKDYPQSQVIPHADLGIMRLQYRNGNSTGVAEQFALLNSGKAPDSLRHHACYLQGVSFIRDGKYQDAVPLLQQVPKKHPEYLFAQHSLAVAYASIPDSTGLAVAPLMTVVQATPQTTAEEEIINRSLVFLGYIFYEGLGEQKRALSNAVSVLRRVPVTSYYYEDALLGLAWCGVIANKWDDCLKACEILKTTSKKPVVQYEAVLLEAYHEMINKKFKQVIEMLTPVDQQIKNMMLPSDNAKNAMLLEYDKTRASYNKLSSRINGMALTEQNSFTKDKMDSLQAPQVEFQTALQKLSADLDGFRRESFFARNINNVRDDIGYALLKAEAMIGNASKEETLKKAAKESKEIDTKVKELQDQLKTIDDKDKDDTWGEDK